MDTCGICLENIKDPVSGNCSHMYCRLCYLNWLDINRICPYCRMPVNNISSFSFSTNSLINKVGIQNIHSYTLNNKDINIFEKGIDVDILKSEINFIKILTGYYIGDKITQNSNNKLICLINDNIITLGMKINKDCNRFYIKDGIAIIRDNKITFKVSPSLRIYKNSNKNIFYEIKNK